MIRPGNILHNMYNKIQNHCSSSGLVLTNGGSLLNLHYTKEEN